MTERSGAIDPKPIISLMFGVSVGFWASQLASFFTEGVRDTSAAAASATAPEFVEPLSEAWWVLLCSGVLFLLDLLCIVWWYARYIYRVQPHASFWTYFLDFAISSMFALAANSWTNPGTFLFTTTFGTSCLGLRFFMLYRGPDASVTDRRILRRAGAMLALALLIAIFGVNEADRHWEGANLLYYGLPGALSLIGVVLTLFLRSMIDVAVDIYTAAHLGSAPTPLEWPQREPPNREQRDMIRRACTQGLEDFDNLFTKFGHFDKMHSRVHSDADVRIQAYVLAVPSCDAPEGGNNLDEITHKAAMTAVSHWLDDLVDGRSEISVWRTLKRAQEITFDRENQPEHQFELFERLYRPLIIKHTGKGFYKQLCEDIAAACPLSFNEPYMWLGLNRIAMGAVMFSPKIPREERARVREFHNRLLKRWNLEGSSLGDEVEAVIDQMSVDNAGRILLALTTKTVQEVAMSSEKKRLDVSLSILYSILYAPLIMYHNIGDELASGEMVSLRQYDSDLETWVPWMRHVRNVIDMDRTDTRREARLSQAEMAFRCFGPLLPPAIEKELRPLYVTDKPADTRVPEVIVTEKARRKVQDGGSPQPQPSLPSPPPPRPPAS